MLSTIKECEQNNDLKDKFYESMDDDFNSAKVIADLFSECSKYKLKDARAGGAIKGVLPLIKDILGLFKHEPIEFIESLKQKYLNILGITRKEINILAKCEEIAKKLLF